MLLPLRGAAVGRLSDKEGDAVLNVDLDVVLFVAVAEGDAVKVVIALDDEMAVTGTDIDCCVKL